ncbi:hypothetical protein NP493_2951g00000 [Ridgeia piscesae]|uniref:Galaxin-like repeats domain-containing protein n=1 Tax=Ridgeia piscesae TaxID=27915 RepID=A0AAD9JAS0_RIDPI|nr:hypothetical protein NP493_2951g00000 [Ridgeia piscesae]
MYPACVHVFLIVSLSLSVQAMFWNNEPKCGDTLFNRDTHFCCDDVLHLVRDDRECCGGEVINTKYYNCIGFGRLFRYWKSLNPRYNCYGTIYDPEIQVCCNSKKIIPKSSEEKC